MPVLISTLMVFAALVISIWISFKKGTNGGLLAFGFAILIAIATKTKFKVLLAGFPTNVVMALFSLTFFFGFLIENGTAEWLAKKLMYATRKVPKFIPYVFFFVCVLMGAFGGPNTLIFCITMAIPIGLACGMPAWESGVICVLGVNCGSYSPMSTHGTISRSFIALANNGHWAESAMTINWYIFFTALIVYLIAITIYYIGFKNYKIKNDVLQGASQPPKATKNQSLCAATMFWMIAMMVIPFVLNKIFPDNAVISYILGYCDITLLATLGAIFMVLMKLGDDKEILKRRVPWGTIVLIFGMGMLIGLASSLGVMDFLTSKLEAMPTWLVTPAFVFFAGFMSVFSSSLSVVYPTLIPIASGIALANTAVNPVAVFAAIVIGAATCAMSPMSMSGAMVMAGTTPEQCDGQKLFKNLLVFAFITLAILVVLAFCGLFGLFSI